MTELRLRPMSDKEFATFCEANKTDFAKQRAVTDFLTLDEAKAVVEEKYRTLLPDGQSTKGHYFFVGEVNGKAVGDGWVYVDSKTRECFLYMIQIETMERGKGLGKALLAALEAEARERGGRILWLNVFENNYRARWLYESSGYSVATLHLSKKIAD
ncbi:MAG: GNAT family N-acetyltransferase [Bdellovibrionota bacterium]